MPTAIVTLLSRHPSLSVALAIFRQNGSNFGSSLRAGRDGQASACGLNAVAHAIQAMAAWIDIIGIKTLAVVAHFNRDVTVHVQQADDDLRGFCIFANVGQ